MPEEDVIRVEIVVKGSDDPSRVARRVLNYFRDLQKAKTEADPAPADVCHFGASCSRFVIRRIDLSGLHHYWPESYLSDDTLFNKAKVWPSRDEADKALRDSPNEDWRRYGRVIGADEVARKENKDILGDMNLALAREEDLEREATRLRGQLAEAIRDACSWRVEAVALASRLQAAEAKAEEAALKEKNYWAMLLEDFVNERMRGLSR